MLEPGVEIEKNTCTRCECLNGMLHCAPYCTIDRCDPGMQMQTDAEGCCYCSPSKLNCFFFVFFLETVLKIISNHLHATNIMSD